MGFVCKITYLVLMVGSVQFGLAQVLQNSYLAKDKKNNDKLLFFQRINIKTHPQYPQFANLQLCNNYDAQNMTLEQMREERKRKCDCEGERALTGIEGMESEKAYNAYWDLEHPAIQDYFTQKKIQYQINALTIGALASEAVLTGIAATAAGTTVAKILGMAIVTIPIDFAIGLTSDELLYRTKAFEHGDDYFTNAKGIFLLSSFYNKLLKEKSNNKYMTSFDECKEKVLQAKLTDSSKLIGYCLSMTDRAIGLEQILKKYNRFHKVPCVPNAYTPCDVVQMNYIKDLQWTPHKLEHSDDTLYLLHHPDYPHRYKDMKKMDIQNHAVVSLH